MSSEIIEARNSVVPVMPVMSVDQFRGQYQLIHQFYDAVMQQDVDYGVIPGTGDKPTLLKPGAQKLGSMFGLAAKFEILEQINDWSGKQHDGEPFLYYRIRANLYQGERLVATGIGSANSWEDRHRYRWMSETEVPSYLDRSKLLKRTAELREFDFAIDKRETTGKYGKPVEHWDMFAEALKSGDYETESVEFQNGRTGTRIVIKRDAYRVPNYDVGSLDNTLLKMANKRAYIDAILYATGASSFFTQDVEDIPDLGYTEGERVASAVVNGSDKVADKAAGKKKLWTDDEQQVRRWAAVISKELGLESGELGKLFTSNNVKAGDFKSQAEAERWVRAMVNQQAGTVDGAELTNETETTHWSQDADAYGAWKASIMEETSLSQREFVSLFVDDSGTAVDMYSFETPEAATKYVTDQLRRLIDQGPTLEHDADMPDELPW